MNAGRTSASGLAGIFASPLDISPMEAKSAEALPDEPGRWQFEPKWDGFRCLAFKQGESVRLRLLADAYYDLRGGVGALGGPSEVVGIRTRNVLSDLLRERCRRSPVVMFIEDLHWADTASQDWLLRIAESDRELPLLIVTACRPHYRPPWADLPGVITLILERLSSEGTVELLQKRIGNLTVPSDLARLIVAKTQGNPLFAEEVTNYLIDRGQIRRSGADILFEEAAESALPITLENSTARTLRSLG